MSKTQRLKLITFEVLKDLLFFSVLVVVGVFLAQNICNISPSRNYIWYEGFWHGLFIIPNWVRSWWINSSTLCMAPHHTAGYLFWWWCLLVLHACIILSCLFELPRHSNRLKPK